MDLSSTSTDDILPLLLALLLYRFWPDLRCQCSLLGTQHTVQVWALAAWLTVEM
jgi:hypothetical protein